MIFSRLELKNWRNFAKVNVELVDRVFIVGPNASGKSNLLDVFRFLRDIVKVGGGLQEAVNIRGGVSKIRCLSARKEPDVEIYVTITDENNEKNIWKYELGFGQTRGGVIKSKAKIKFEKITNLVTNEIELNRPNEDDKKDERLLEYTHLEQIGLNAKFREIADFFQSISYLHIIPQLLRDTNSFSKNNKEDFYGRDFIERINKTPKNIRNSYLKKIEQALTSALPQFQNLGLIKDKMGIPHLKAGYKHWRSEAVKQQEDQFSDGTLRLIGLLWALQDGNKPILLEEPELSLHTEIVRLLAEIIAKLQKKRKRQVFLTTHSYDLLSNKGIGSEEILVLEPTKEGTEVKNASSLEEIKILLNTGMNPAEAILPITKPKEVEQFFLGF
ncbi:AAA family ATPase [bacterium]|nr:AAA family ATPase [bacterium]